MSVKLLTKDNLEFLSLKETTQPRLSLHLSNCHIVGNHMSWLKFFLLLSSLNNFQSQEDRIMLEVFDLVLI